MAATPFRQGRRREVHPARTGRLPCARAGQIEHAGQQIHRPAVRGGAGTLDIPDRPHTEAGPLGEFLLGQPRGHPAAADEFPETARTRSAYLTMPHLAQTPPFPVFLAIVSRPAAGVLGH